MTDYTIIDLIDVPEMQTYIP